MTRPRHLPVGLRAALLIGLVLWVYWPAVHGEWLWDDGYEVAHNSLLRDAGGLAKIWRGEGALDYFPLKATIQWLLWRVWSDQVMGWHLLSIGLHALSALILVRLLRRLGIHHAWLGGMLFALHPLAVESVAWCAELKNTLSLPLVLAAFDAYLDYDDRERRRDLARAVALFIAALLCKSTVVMLPCVLLLYLWWKYDRSAWPRAVSLVPFFGAALLLGLVTVWFQYTRAIGQAELPVGGAATRIARAGVSLAFYAWKALWPLELMPVYPRWPVANPRLHQFLPWVGFAGLFGLLWAFRRTWGRHVLFGVGAFCLNLAPILGFLAMAYMHAAWVADHFAYAALPAVAGLGAAAVQVALTRVPPNLRGIAQAAAAGIVGVLALHSHVYARIFRSPAALWDYAVAHNPHSAVVRNNLGNALVAAGDVPAAAIHFGAAAALEPRHVGVRLNLGHALARLGRVEEAVRHHEQALAIAPRSFMAANSLGATLIEAGRLAEARRTLELALALAPGSAEAHNNLAIVAAREGNDAAARHHFSEALRLDPQLESAQVNLHLWQSQAGDRRR